MKKKNNRRHTIFNLLTLFILTAAILCSVGFAVSANSDKASDKTNTYYQSVRVQSGDTLWSIAEEYCPYTQEIDDYIDDIKTINNIKNTNIKAGDYIIVSVAG